MYLIEESVYVKAADVNRVITNKSHMKKMQLNKQRNMKEYVTCNIKITKILYKKMTFKQYNGLINSN